MDKATIYEALGLTAGLLSTFANLPQIIKAWRSRSVKDLSVTMYLMASTGVFLWMIYGYMIGSLSLCLWNLVTLSLTSTLLIMKLRWSKQDSSSR